MTENKLHKLEIVFESKEDMDTLCNLIEQWEFGALGQHEGFSNYTGESSYESVRELESGIGVKIL